MKINMRNFSSNCSILDCDALAVVESPFGFLKEECQHLKTGLMQAVTSIVWIPTSRWPVKLNTVRPFADENKKDPCI
jgi:hypothetical protein